jgi:hypothetical protein
MWELRWSGFHQACGGGGRGVLTLGASGFPGGGGDCHAVLSSYQPKAVFKTLLSAIRVFLRGGCVALYMGCLLDALSSVLQGPSVSVLSFKFYLLVCYLLSVICLISYRYALLGTRKSHAAFAFAFSHGARTQLPGTSFSRKTLELTVKP